MKLKKNKIFIVAEVGNNHEGSISNAYKLIEKLDITYNLNFSVEIQKLSNSYILVLIPWKTCCKPTKLKTSQFSIHQ